MSTPSSSFGDWITAKQLYDQQHPPLAMQTDETEFSLGSLGQHSSGSSVPFSASALTFGSSADSSNSENHFGSSYQRILPQIHAPAASQVAVPEAQVQIYAPVPVQPKPISHRIMQKIIAQGGYIYDAGAFPEIRIPMNIGVCWSAGHIHGVEPQNGKFRSLPGSKVPHFSTCESINGNGPCNIAYYIIDFQTNEKNILNHVKDLGRQAQAVGKKVNLCLVMSSSHPEQLTAKVNQIVQAIPPEARAGLEIMTRLFNSNTNELSFLNPFENHLSSQLVQRKIDTFFPRGPGF